MKTKDGYTPKETAYAVAIGWLDNAYHGATQDVECFDERPHVQKQIKRQIAKLHNKLLRKSNLDGIELEENISLIQDCGS